MLAHTNKKRAPEPAPGDPALSGRQREIVAAAVALIAQKGVPALTTRALAERLGVTEPALYRHFRDKADILLAILAAFRAGQAVLHDRVEAESASPLRRIEALLAGVFRGFAAQPAMVSVVLAEGRFEDDPRLARAILAIMDDRRDRLTALLEAGRKAGEIRPEIEPAQAALLLMGGMRLLATRWRLSGLAFDLESEGRKMIEAARRMLAAGKNQPRKGEGR